jgi:AcrR family transcriptional regulator
VVDTEAPTRRGPRGPYAKSLQTRKVILDAALEVFAQSGYRSGSLRDVAARVDMSEAGLLHHFPNKSALLAAVLEHRDEHSNEQFEFDRAAGRPALQDLVDLAAYNATTPGVVQLFCTLSAEATSPEHPAHQYFKDRSKMTVGLVRQSIESVRHQGGLRAGVDPASAARQMIAMWDGLQIQWLLDPDSVDVADELRAFFNRLLIDPLD